MIIEIHDLPGGSCGPTPEGGEYVNMEGPEGGVDCTGTWMFGTPGERHLGLRWATVADDGSILVFRAAKLRLNDIDPTLTRRAVDEGKRLVASLGLTDEQGWPRYASVRPPIVAWSVA
jgi:Family of unknown function (DUF5990)